MSFEEHMRDIVKTLGMQDKMIPVKDVYEARKADLLTVVKIKKSTWGSIVGIIWSHPKEDYSITQHHLRELLQGSDTVDFGHAACDQFVEVSHERKVGIGMEIEVPVNSNVLDAGGRVQKTEECSTSPLNLEMKSQKLNDVLNQLDSSQMNEKLIQRLTCSSNVKLGFIYEILRSPGPISLHRNVKGGGGLNLKLANVTKVGASACTMDNQKVTLPSNSTVAFTVHPLPTQELLCECGTEESVVCQMPSSCPRVAICFNPDFETTEQSVKEELVGFEDLSQPTKKYIRELLFRILATPQSLRPLDWMLEERCADEENLSRVTEELQPAVKELLTAAGLFPAEPAKSNDLLKPLGLLVSALAGRRKVSPHVQSSGKCEDSLRF
ncbi:hypothetical protein GN956_G26103 [Arapaima gigas]